MISPNTPPGTPVVCIDATGVPALTKGQQYRVAQMTAVPRASGEPVIAVELVGIVGGEPSRRLAFWRWRFRRVDLPESLTRWLKKAPRPVAQKVDVE